MSEEIVRDAAGNELLRSDWASVDNDPTLAGNSATVAPSQQAVKSYVDAQRGEVLVADFVTTSASVGDLEMIFTDVPCTSGKTYYFEVELWLNWATAGTSGPAMIATSLVSPGSLTTSDGRMIGYADGGLVNSGTDTVDNSNTSFTAAATWQRYFAHGFFTASSSDDFNVGINIPAWDSGDVVTIKKGARLKVTQVD